VGGAPEITVLQLPKFKAEATKLIGADGIEAVAVYLIDHPDAGAVIPGAGGARSCGGRNVRTDLTTNEKKDLRQIAAHLKGVR
jgi:hypothetical protein